MQLHEEQFDHFHLLTLASILLGRVKSRPGHFHGDDKKEDFDDDNFFGGDNAVVE